MALPTCKPAGSAANAKISATATIASGFTQYTTRLNIAAISITPWLVFRTENAPTTKHPNRNTVRSSAAIAKRKRPRR